MTDFTLTHGDCEDLPISVDDADSLVELQQKLVVAWVLANTSRCSWECFLQGLGCPLNTISLEDTYDPVVFGTALTAAIFNEGVIAALRAQLNLGRQEADVG